MGSQLQNLLSNYAGDFGQMQNAMGRFPIVGQQIGQQMQQYGQNMMRPGAMPMINPQYQAGRPSYEQLMSLRSTGIPNPYAQQQKPVSSKQMVGKGLAGLTQLPGGPGAGGGFGPIWPISSPAMKAGPDTGGLLVTQQSPGMQYNTPVSQNPPTMAGRPV